MNKNLARRSLVADIQNGNATDQFFGHLTEAGLTKEETILALAQMAEAAAARKTTEAQIVSASVYGSERLTGTDGFEIKRAEGLKRLAAFFRNLLP